MNNIKLIVRSHEIAQEGYKWHHNGKVLTIFSASNYCGRNDNKGAIAVFNTKEYSTNRRPKIVTYHAQEQSNKEHILFLCIEDTLQKLRETIFRSRHILTMEFEKYDTENTGLICLDDWVASMEAGISIPLNWRSLQPFLTDVDNDNMVHYVKFLDRFKIKPDKEFWIEWEKSIAEKVCRKIYDYFPCLKEAFLQIDKNSDQKISYTEFLSIIEVFNLDLTREQVYDFMRTIDTNRDGYIDFNEFCTKFERIYERITLLEQKRPIMEKIDLQIKDIAQKIKDCGRSIEEIFAAYDIHNQGVISYEQFKNLLQTLFFVNYSEEEYHLLANYVDFGQTGEISLQEFKKSFNFLPDEDHEMFYFVLSSLHDALDRGKYHLRSIFYKMDIDGSGTVDKEEFLTGFKALKVFTDVNIQEDRLMNLFDFIDTNKDGKISYEEFLNSFKIVDTHYCN